MKRKIVLSILIVLLVGLGLFGYFRSKDTDESEKNSNSGTVKSDYLVDLSKLTYNDEEIKIYTQDDFDNFKSDYENNALPEVYITEFLFDGAGMYKTYDLDDFIEEGNDTEVKTLKETVFNVNRLGETDFTGEITGGMIAVNTNDVKGEIILGLNGVNIDTDSKKIPAIYVYNKDINYTDAKVTISALKGTKNYIEGGKLKKVSLIGSDELSSYSSRYTGSNSSYYSEYTNYYGVYTSSEIEKVLFAKITADNEDLSDGDPYYFYKAAGAISSDIDLYFEGEGELNITSKNKEGVETKGNLTFSGAVGDYYIVAQDDCLNTTTGGTDARNTLTIDVNKMFAIVDLEADEGDAIDSNGSLIINGGLIVAIAKPGSDAGLDSESGTYINKGRVFATGDMYDEIKSDSKQDFLVLSLNGASDTLLTLVDPDNEAIMFSYKSDRTFTNLIYSNNDVNNDTSYILYEGGTIEGESTNGFYTNISKYVKGTELSYSNGANMMGPGTMPGGMPMGGFGR